MRKAFVPITMNQLVPLTQPNQRSRLPVHPPLSHIINAPAPPPTPELWHVAEMKRAKSANKMQEVLKWRFINAQYE